MARERTPALPGTSAAIRMFDSRIDNLEYADALNLVVEFAARSNGTSCRSVFFTNVHTILATRKSEELTAWLETADLVLPDGSGLKIAGIALGTPIRANLNGTDFTPRLLTAAAERRLSVYLLGARQTVVDACCSQIAARYPGLGIAGSHHGFFSAEDEQEILDDINAKRPSIVLVALGTPLQERWITRYAPSLNAGVCLAVGGLFDFLSGDKRRAPAWMRKAGIEWMYRFFQDPRSKWSRVFVETPHFLFLIAWRLIVRRGRKIGVGT